MRLHVGFYAAAALLALAVSARAAPPSAADRTRAMGTALTSEMQALVEATAQVIADEREIAALKAEIAAAKKPQDLPQPKGK